ncbi:hypothetical protein EVC37_15555 [Methylocaldum sp. BRCS4]|jgi:hypothetical protein|uniref:hypothetical protein n=1 Tax=Methylocaldum sp. 14B TaxID=1912213 RepID=UPI00098B3EB5|nr:hypothetical protein [Methylocaldum sp. 14B]MVF23020.1 hypothetical protein [Methylocaldum sp. BRCS4]
MKFFPSLLRIVIAAFSIGYALSGSTTEAPDRTVAGDKSIQRTETEDEHQRMTTYYEREAAFYKRKAKAHQKISDEFSLAYQYPIPTRVDNRQAFEQRIRHCKNLARLFNETAEEYLSLAREHSQPTE